MLYRLPGKVFHNLWNGLLFCAINNTNWCHAVFALVDAPIFFPQTTLPEIPIASRTLLCSISWRICLIFMWASHWCQRSDLLISLVSPATFAFSDMGFVTSQLSLVEFSRWRTSSYNLPFHVRIQQYLCPNEIMFLFGAAACTLNKLLVSFGTYRMSVIQPVFSWLHGSWLLTLILPAPRALTVHPSPS